MSRQIFIAYAAIVLIWGSTWTSIRVEMGSGAPLTSVGLRFLLAGIALLLFRKIIGARTMPVPWRVTAVMGGFVFGLNYICNYVAETKVPPSLTAVLFATLPFFVFLFNALLGERERRPQMVVGCAIAFCGVAIVYLAGRNVGIGYYSIAALGAASFAALGQVLIKRQPSVDPLSSVPGAMVWSGIAVLALGIISEHPDIARITTAPYLANLAYLAIVGSAIAFYLNFWLLNRIPTATLGMAALLFPIVALFIGLFVTGEHLQAHELFGSLVVLVGAAWALVPRRPYPGVRHKRVADH